MKKIFKIALILICITFMLYALSSIVFGSTVIDPNNYNPGNRSETENSPELKAIGNTIVGIIRTVGSFMSVAVLIVLGIIYMAGSVEEKAKYKESMISYVIGAALVFGITNILAFIINVAGVFE